MANYTLAAAFALLALPALGQDYQAVTTSNAVVRQAPGPDYAQIGTIPAGSTVSVEVCFDRGAFCLVTDPTKGFVSGDLMTIGATGQTVRSAEQAKWAAIDAKPASSLTFTTLPTREIRTEGDSYMEGAYGIALNQLIAKETRRPVVNTAKGGSEISGVVDRINAAENSRLLADLTIFWDGSNNGMTTVSAYADRLEAAIRPLGHDRFLIVPPMHGTELAEVTAELKRRWPNNVIDWRDVVGDYEGAIPTRYLANPAEDQTHLNASALAPMAKAIASAIGSRAW